MRHLLCSAVLVLVACGSESSGSPAATRSVFAVPTSLDALEGKGFFDHPFPSDLRKDAAGAIVFKGFPNPQGLPLLARCVTAGGGLLKGFSTAAAAALRFEGPLDPQSLPADPTASLANDSSVQIVDVDPTSPDHGKRHL